MTTEQTPQDANGATIGAVASTAMLGAWRPIDTCPPFPFDKETWFKDGPRYLLWVGGYCTIGSYGYTQKGKGRWRNYLGSIHPTHWMPLPEAPNVK